MATLQKQEFVNFAMRKAGFSGDTMLNPADEEQKRDALIDLEAYMTEFHNERKQNNDPVTPYIFATSLDELDGSDDSGLDLNYLSAIGYQLALRVIDDAQRPVPSGLAKRADRAMKALLTTLWVPTPLKRRNDMPTGDGNRTYWPAGRFYNDGSGK
nr:MAG: P22 tail accessory factor [Bacteriophage sp.]